MPGSNHSTSEIYTYTECTPTDGYMNSLEWSGGMDYWTGVEYWSGPSRFSQSEKLRNYLATRFCAIHAVSNQQSYIIILILHLSVPA